ncbi:MAG: tetratricopeptide repeat protein [Spirochaetes bacterium]|nr:tetratricopeptide repeat protein [Spirochaetota bacterium]
MRNKKVLLFYFIIILLFLTTLFYSCGYKNNTIRNDVKKRISYYIEEGTKYFNKGDINKAFTNYLDALNMAISINDLNSEFLVLTKILMIYIFKEDDLNCLIYIKKIEEIIKHEKERLSENEYYFYYYVKGDYYFFKKDFDNSLLFYNKALSSTKHDVNFAFIYNKISKVYIEIKNYDQATNFLIKAQKIAENKKAYNLLGDIYYNLAKIYYLTEKYSEALNYINKAFYADNINENVFGIFYDYLLISEIYEKINDKEKQLYYLSKAYHLAFYLNLEKYIKKIEEKLKNIN